MARITSADYRTMRRDTVLTDAAIEIFIAMAAEKVTVLDSLVLAESKMKNVELWLALYFASAVDRRKTSEGIPPASTAYETIPYLEYLRTLLGDYYPLLGDIDGTALQPAEIFVITANEC